MPETSIGTDSLLAKSASDLSPDDINTVFIEVILPLALPNTFTYRVPNNLIEQVEIGNRVEVQFGKQKVYSALVATIKNTPPKDYQVKYINTVLDETPIVTESQLQFWQWIAEYYMCTIGEVMNAALPSGLKLSSETRILMNPDFDIDHEGRILDDKEFMVAEALDLQEELSIKDISAILNIKTVYPIVKSLLQKKVVIVEEELIEKYKPKVVSYIGLAEEYKAEANLRILFDALEKAPKQLESLMTYLQINKTQVSSESYGDLIPVKKSDLLKGNKSNPSALNALVKKGIFIVFEKETDRLQYKNDVIEGDIKFSNSQKEAYQQIKEIFESKEVILLHGETSSGKTLLYIQLIQETIAKGKQVLYLLPEIALTAQIIKRLRKYFGDKVGVYHSKYSDNERVEVWNKTLNKEYAIVIGARSAVFLPFKELGLIIVDEEHENTFKQFDPSPRYNARDAAIVLANIHQSTALLGTATPSFESFTNARQEKYGLVTLKERYGGVQMPEIVIVDAKEEARKKKMKSHFTSVLLDHINGAFENNEQVILFQNRRGFVPFLECNQCAYVPQCIHCDVSLTYHKYENQLRCHYCGYSKEVFIVCPACGNDHIEMRGFGTEKIENDLKDLVPGVKVNRLDLDTTRSKYGYQKIISDFEDRKIDVLVGTQMITKGLDFDNVSIVGILSADSLLNYPDFRAFEHAYQLMAQVSGRSGRKNKRGKVIIQSYQPEHPIIRFVLNNDYLGMYDHLIKERKNYKYPPFYRLVKITLKHRDIRILNLAMGRLRYMLDKKFAGKILGPEFPPIKRIKNRYLKNILLKLEKNASTKTAKSDLSDILQEYRTQKENRVVTVHIDVDPM